MAGVVNLEPPDPEWLELRELGLVLHRPLVPQVPLFPFTFFYRLCSVVIRRLQVPRVHLQLSCTTGRGHRERRT